VGAQPEERVCDILGTVMVDAFAAIASIEADARKAHPEQRAQMLRSSLERLVQHFAEHRALYVAVATLPLSRDAYLDGVRTMAEFIEGSIGQRAPAPSFMRPDLTARFIAGATYGLLDAWLRGEFEATPLELLEHIDRLTPEWYRS
jgi:hypothetical protein